MASGHKNLHESGDGRFRQAARKRIDNLKKRNARLLIIDEISNGEIIGAIFTRPPTVIIDEISGKREWRYLSLAFWAIAVTTSIATRQAAASYDSRASPLNEATANIDSVWKVRHRPSDMTKRMSRACRGIREYIKKEESNEAGTRRRQSISSARRVCQ